MNFIYGRGINTLQKKKVIKVKCSICDKEFIQKNKRHKYCSNKCKIKGNKKNIILKNRICPICGNSFLTSRKTYCSDKCMKEKQKYIKKELGKGKCIICNKKFQKIIPQQIICSEKCLNKYNINKVKNNNAIKELDKQLMFNKINNKIPYKLFLTKTTYKKEIAIESLSKELKVNKEMAINLYTVCRKYYTRL